MAHQAEEGSPGEVRRIVQEALPLLQQICREHPDDTLCQKYYPQFLDLHAYAYRFFEQNLDSALLYADSAYRLLERAGYIREATGVLENLACYYHHKGQITQSIDAHYKVWDRAATLGDTRLLFYTMNNLATIFSEIGLQDSATRFYLRALNYAELLGDPSLQGTVLSNLATLYYDQRLFQEAMAYTWKAVQLRLRGGDLAGAAIGLSNLGTYYEEGGNPDSALTVLREALHYARKSASPYAQALAFSNLARAYMDKQQWDSAYLYLNQLLAVRANAPSPERFRACLSMINYYIRRAASTSDPGRQHQLYQKALEWEKKTQPLLPAIKDVDALRNYYGALYRLYSAVKDPAKALEAHEKFIFYRDSLRTLKAQKNAIESRYLYEWQQQEKALLKEHIRQEERRKRLQTALLFAALLAAGTGISAWFFRKLYRQTRIQRDIIASQKQKIEESYGIIRHQHEELRKSLRYAQRIQRALLPPEQALQTLPHPCEVWYQPCQEVGGDFYWIQQAPQEGRYMLVLGDGTGHGVPGGFITVLAITLLESIWEEGITDLKGVAAIFSHRFSVYLHSEDTSGLKDGVEAILLSISLRDRHLRYVNAGGSVRGFYITQGGLIELLRSGPGLGYDMLGRPLSWQEEGIDLGQGGRLVLFSDGLRDQLGENGRKWPLRQLHKTLMETAALPIPQALSSLKSAWSQHKGPLPQVDDVTVWMIDFTPQTLHA